MTDQERLIYAKKYVEQMANGINPLNQQPIAEQDLLNNVHISRCLFFVSDVLQSVIENTTAKSSKRKRGSGLFYITDEQIKALQPSEHDLLISHIADIINVVAEENQCRRISASLINQWLLHTGLLELKEERFKVASLQGTQLGIRSTIQTALDGREYYRNIFSPSAQQFIFDNLPAILVFRDME